MKRLTPNEPKCALSLEVEPQVEVNPEVNPVAEQLPKSKVYSSIKKLYHHLGD